MSSWVWGSAQDTVRMCHPKVHLNLQTDLSSTRHIYHNPMSCTDLLDVKSTTSTRHYHQRDGGLAYLDGSKSCGSGCQASSGICQDRVGVQSNQTLATGTPHVNSNSQLTFQ